MRAANKASSSALSSAATAPEDEEGTPETGGGACMAGTDASAEGEAEEEVGRGGSGEAGERWGRCDAAAAGMPAGVPESGFGGGGGGGGERGCGGSSIADLTGGTERGKVKADAGVPSWCGVSGEGERGEYGRGDVGEEMKAWEAA